MIAKRIADRKDGQSSAASLLRYAEGLKVNADGERLDKSLRTRISNFDLVDDVVLANESIESRERIIALCATEMQANCDMNKRVDPDRKIAHFLVAFAQERPTDAMLDDIEDSMIAKLDLQKHHRSSFLHNDNGHWHLHIAVSRIDRDPPYRANVLRRDFELRDRVCREMELKYGLRRDKGIHRITEAGEIVIDESRIPSAFGVGDKAQSMERHAGLLSFQGWCIDTGFAAKMSQAGTWTEMHHIAGQFDCRVAPRGAGFVVISRSSDTHVTKLSQLGVGSVVKRLGEFQPSLKEVVFTTRYALEPALRQQGRRMPTSAETDALWERYKYARAAWNTNKAAQAERLKADIRDERNALRACLRDQKRQINRDSSLDKAAKEQLCSRVAMDAAQDEMILREREKAGRAALDGHAKATNPGDNFRHFLLKMAETGDEEALEAARQYASAEVTSLIDQEEAEQRPAYGAIGPDENNRIRARHAILGLRRTVLRNGSVIYDLGGERLLTDTAKGLIKFSAPAAFDREAVEAGLLLAQNRFGSKLTLHGSFEFQKFAVATAVNQNIGVTFADPRVEAYRLTLIRQKAEAVASAQTAKAEFALPTEPKSFDDRDVTPFVSPPQTKTAPAAATEISFDAQAFVRRRNTLINAGEIVDVQHRVGNETDLVKAVIFAELRSSERAEGPKLAVFAILDRNDVPVGKIVFAVNAECARRLDNCDRGRKRTVKAFSQDRGLSNIEFAPEQKRKAQPKQDVKKAAVKPSQMPEQKVSGATAPELGGPMSVKSAAKKTKPKRR